MNSRELLKSKLSFYRAYQPRKTPSQWIEEYIVLPPGKYESKPGKIDFGYAPYLREIVDALEEPGVRDVVFVAPTRMGKTLVLRLVFACGIAKNPMSLILYDSTIEKGRNLVKKELKPLIEYNPVLADLKPKNRNHFSDSHMLFPAASVDIFGANSAAGAAGDTAKLILGNEVDKWKGETNKEASMIELVRHRTESAEGERKHYFSSTPTTEDGNVWSEYVNSDQRKYFVPCPCCGHMQHLKWPQVRWAIDAKVSDTEWDYERVLETACYVCEECHSEWTDAMRLEAIRDPRAEWRPTAKPKSIGKRGYHLNGLYGPLQSNRVGELAVDFLASKKAGWIENSKDFWNSRMGEPFRDEVRTVTVDKFESLCGEYARGHLPDTFKPDVLIMGVDVQSYGMPYVVKAYKWSGEIRTVDHGLAATFADLDRVQSEYMVFKAPSYVVMDIGYSQRSAEVLDAIHKRRNRGWIGAEGFEQVQNLTKITQRDPALGTRKQGSVANIQVLQVSTYEFKCEWERMFSKDNPKWMTYSVYPESTDQDKQEQIDYFAQLLDERRVPRKMQRPNKPRYEWKPKTGRNHFFDCHVYSLALFFHLSRSRGYARNRQTNTTRRGSISVAT